MLFTAREFLRSVAPAYLLPEPLVFEGAPSPIAMLHFNESQSETLTVRTNIDFAAVSKLREDASAGALNPSDVLSQIVLVRAKVEQAATLGMELAASPLHSSMISRRVNNVLVRARDKSEGDVESFSEIILHNGVAVRETVNSGARSFAEIVELLDRAEPFKKWLRDQPHTEQLIGAYVRDATAGTWAEKLPKKPFRWAAFLGTGQAIDHAGLGGIGTATAFAVSAFDGFVLDRLIGGWNPSQFVDGPLRGFVAQ